MAGKKNEGKDALPVDWSDDHDRRARTNLDIDTTRHETKVRTGIVIFSLFLLALALAASVLLPIHYKNLTPSHLSLIQSALTAITAITSAATAYYFSKSK